MIVFLNNIKFFLLCVSLFVSFFLGMDSAFAVGSVKDKTEAVVQPYLGITPAFGRWNTAIPWVYNPTNASPLFSDSEIVQLLKEAMAEWEEVCGVRFDYRGVNATLANVSSDGLVVVFWGGAGGAAASAGPSRSYSDSSAKTLGYDPYTDGSVELNNQSFDWTNNGQYTSTMKNRAFKSVLVHELGHLIGLGHSNNPASVMYANPYNSVAHLLEDDILAARAFYGLSANPATEGKYQYTPPEGDISPFTRSYIYLNPTGSTIDTGKDNPVTEMSQNTPDSSSLIFRTEFKGPLTQTVELHVTDPFGSIIHEVSSNLSCKLNFSCSSSNEVTASGILKGIPGQYHIYVTANNKLLVDSPFTVTSTPSWNHSPAVSVSYSTTSGFAPLTVTADLTAIDPEGQGMSVTWHIPGQGIVNETNFTGRANKSLNFSVAGTYIVYAVVNDNGPRYDGTGRSSPASKAGEGVQSVSRQVITVTNAVTDLVVLPATVRAGEIFYPLAGLSSSGVAIKQYLWDFGDGTTATGTAPSHAFAKPGQYVVSLTATTVGGEEIKNNYPLTVIEGRYSIRGTLSGLANGDSLDLIAISAAVGVTGKVKVDGTGSDLPFTIQGLPPAADYRLYLPPTVYAGGYWGGIAGTESSVPVNATLAKNIDLTNGHADNINIKVNKGRILNVTLNGLTKGDQVTVSAWSVTSGGLVTNTITATATAVTVALPGLSPVVDTLFYVKSPPGKNYRDGFYNGDGSVPAGILRAKKLDLSQGDLSISLSMGTGQSIRGTLTNLVAGESVQVTAWSGKTAQGGSVTVTGNGDYSISGLLPADDYTVCVETVIQAGGCYSGLSGVGLVAYTQAAKLDLSADSRTGINLALESGRRVHGQVAGLSATDVAWVEASSANAGHWSTVQVKNDGTFLLQGLPKAGDYRLTVRAEGYQIPKEQVVDLSEATDTVVNFNLFRGGKVQGSVAGLKVGDVVTVEVRSKTTRDSREVTLLAKDTMPVSYLLDGLVDAKDFVVSIRAAYGRFFYGTGGTVRNSEQAKLVAIVGGSSVIGIDFDVGTAVSFKIAGSISGLGSAQANNIVTLTAWSTGGNLATVSRAGDGAFVLSGLPAGDYYLAVGAAGFVTTFYDGSGWSAAFGRAATVSVTADVNNLAVPLVSGYSISGAVSYLGSTVANANISVWDSTQGFGGNTLSRLDGTYRIGGLTNSSSYRVTAQASEGRAVLDGVVVAGADVTGQRLVLTKAAGSIRGTTKAGALLLLYIDNGDFVTSTVADSGGVYLFTGLKTDVTYRVDVDTDDRLDSVEATGKATPTAAKPEATLDLLLVVLNTSLGAITVKLDPAKAPVTVKNFLSYVDSGFYDGLIFHRVISGFMVQGGTATADLEVRGPTLPPIKNEADNGLKNFRGTVAMARTTEINSATSQFFINLVDNYFLDYGYRDFGYAVFGKVVQGMDVVDKIGAVKIGSGDIPLVAVTISTARRK